MHIYIDESGVFKTATHNDAWCVVAAYVLPECHMRHVEQLILNSKLQCGKTYKDEIKLKDLSEDQYISLLSSLNKFSGTLFATATDMSLLSDSDVWTHRDIQAEKVVEHIDKMRYETGKNSLRGLSQQIKELSPQLYMQLVCQIILISDVLNRGVLFFVQRYPRNLRCFKWRIDQKNTNKIEYEDAFEKIAPGILQSQSLREPSIMVREFDYSAMKEFFYRKENAPNYLKEEYGIEIDTTGSLNVGKVLHDDLKFEDSRISIGIQIADLLASGLRRLLRGEFQKQDEIAKLIGKLMIKPFKGKQPINLVSFTDAYISNPVTESVIKHFNQRSINMLL